MKRRAALLLVLAGVGSALAHAAVPLPDDYRLDGYDAPVPDTVPGGTVIHTQALHTLLADEHVVLLDVLAAPRRPAGIRPDTPWLPVPHRDLPGSLWLPEAGGGALAPGMEQGLQQALLRASAGNRDQPVVVYCKQDCWRSWNAAKRVAEHGWRRVYWYPDGPEGWQAAGFPLADAQPLP